MDGVHDLGGRMGFGAVANRGPDDKVFLSTWERRVMGMTFVSFVRGLHNGGEFRHGIERMSAVQYLSTRYYEHWFTGLATSLVAQGVVDRDELEGRAGGHVPLSLPVHVAAAAEADLLLAHPPTYVPAVGDQVRVIAGPRVGHSRCPAYVRDRVGEVVRVDGEASLPDVEAHVPARRHEPTCCVRFRAEELWGPTAEPAAVHVDLWASYLAPVDQGETTHDA